jgi:hypothetical protein
MPQGITDRDADVWEALLTVADAAGGDWPRLARVAAVALVAASKESTPSLGIKLLQDIHTVFDGADQLPTERILEKLHALEESPWGDLKGKPLDSRGLARRLREHDIKPITIRTATSTPKGYRRSAFMDAWSRYLPKSPGSAEMERDEGAPHYESATAATSATPSVPDMDLAGAEF